MIKKITLVTKSFFKFIAAFVALFTMTISPLAQAAQAESLKKDALERMLSDIGLNRQITVGDFYQKNKQLFPEGIRLQIEPMIEQFKDQMMPVFELTMLQNSNGEQTPVIRVTQQGQLHTIQIYDDENKTVRFNNTDLSLQDVENFNLMIDKLYYREPRLRKQVGGPDKIVNVNKNNNNKSIASVPTLSFESWSNLSPDDKAKYIYYLRKIRSEARFILDLEKFQNKKTQNTSYFDLLKRLFVQDLHAKRNGPVLDSRDRGSKVKSSNSDACIIAGFISEYDSRGSCSKEKIKTNYDLDNGFNKIAKNALDSCAKGELACNPYLYGVKSDGKGFCLPVNKSENFQKATWSGFGCDALSPLGKPIKFLHDDSSKKKEDRYQDDNYAIKPENIIEEYKNQLANEGPDGPYYANIKRFLESMIKTPNGIDFKKEIDNTVFEQILALKNVFDSEITQAKEICIKAATNKKNEKNFYGACDQLQRRFVLIGEFLKKSPGCKSGSQFDETTLKCNCDNGTESVNPGGTCSDKPAGTPVSSTTVVDQGASETAPVQSGQCSEKCKDNEICKNLNTANYGGRDRWVCIPDGKSSSGVWDKIWKYGKWALIGVGIYAGVKYLLPVFFPKKPKLNAAGDACANGISSACVTTCPNRYQSRVNGVCQCAVCPPGTSLVDGTTCTCSTAATASVLFTCADKVTQVTDQSLCPPTANIRCPDGVTYVTNINACPNTPSVKPSSSGTGQ